MAGHPISVETRKKISETAKRNKKSGGYRHGSGRGKHGWYHDYWCDSTYELVFVIYCIDHEIKFSRNSIKYPYKKDGEIHYYLPDFVMDNGDLVEIKGYLTLEELLKISAVKDRKIKILFYEDIKYMFDYVSKKYKTPGDKLFRLYTLPFKKYEDEKDKVERLREKYYFGSECAWCGKPFISKYKQRCCSNSCINKLRKIDTNRELYILSLISNSGIDLMKFGYVSKLCELYPNILTKRIVLHLLRKYDVAHFERSGSIPTRIRV